MGGCLGTVVLFFAFPKVLPYLKIKTGKDIGLIGKYTVESLPTSVLLTISSGLTSIDDDGSVHPELASSWEISPDYREYIFTLETNLVWDDNKPFLAKDVNYNFSDVATTPLGTNTIKFTLKEPFAPFLSVVSKPIFKKNLIGVGKEKIASLKLNGQVIEKMNFKNGSSLRFYPNEKSAKLAFQLGEIQEIQGIANPQQLENWKNVKITPEINYHQFVGIFFDTANPALNSKSLRQALAYAVKDRWEPAALSPISIKSWTYNKDVKPYNYDLANAKTLFKKAVGEDNHSMSSITLSTIPSLLSTAENIKADWEQLGLETKIKVINNFEEGFEALLVTQDIPSDPDQYTLWHSTQPNNISKYNNPKVDKLLEEGRKTHKQEERKEIYLDFQKTIVEDLPAIFLYYPTSYNISRK